MNGWVKKRLDEVCTLQRGFDLPTSQRKEGEHPLVSSSGCIDSQAEVKVFGPGVVTGRSGSIGSVFFIDQDFWPLNTTLYVKDFHGNDPRFIYYLLRKFDLKRFSSGAGVPTLNRNSVHSEIVYVPSKISEQRRIVAIADQAFEGIDRAIANTEKNLTNARELFESYLNAIFTQKGNGWVEKKLGDIATFRNGLNFTKSSKGESIRIVGVKDFQNYFWLKEDQLESVTIDGELKKIDTLRKRDILTVRSNGNKELIGRCILVGDLSEKTSHSGFTIRIRIEREDIYHPFIVHFLKSKELRKQLADSGGGINISSLNQQGLSLIMMSFPSFTEQKAIVASIDEIATETQRLEAIYQQKLAALNELKQSILQKAFTGELTADTTNQMTKAVKEVVAA
jgi:type I restriction enzyme, S subunit